MTRLKLVSTKISSDLVDRLEQYTQSIESTQSAVIRNAIEYHLDKVDPVDKIVDPVDKAVYPVDPLRSEIEDIKARLTALERSTRLTTVYPISEVNPLEPSTQSTSLRSTRPTKVSAQFTGESIGAVEESVSAYGICNHLLVLTTGELFMALEGKGYQKSIGTLRRALKLAIETGNLPDDLTALGVTADFEVRRSANPKDNSVRWLFVK